ncbi:zinc finger BED domain-containing protein RICESLEEPER 2-like [Aristolochia californica]|uniref:zinc finger BED domain-containing protein RICESLEEPER 2-like n=1 Tax=Aristolochia californica TaxID=171875 RepID=UPI0035E31189
MWHPTRVMMCRSTHRVLICHDDVLGQGLNTFIGHVQDVLVQIKDIIETVDERVKFINLSETRLHTFFEILQRLELDEKMLVIDCPTRWNFTYNMFSSALKFKDVFPRFQVREPMYDCLPSLDEWEKVEMVCEILEVFNAVINIIFGSDYPTTYLYLSAVYRVKEVLNVHFKIEYVFIWTMVRRMKEKFEKYWGECNLLIVVTAVLDPRVKGLHEFSSWRKRERKPLGQNWRKKGYGLDF